MTDKLAKKILDEYTSEMKGLLDFGNYAFVGVPYENALKAMQAYHEAKMKEITDADIEAWVSKQFLHGESALKGAKAFRDGVIVSSNRD